MPYYRFSYIEMETSVVGFSLVEFHDDAAAMAHAAALHQRGGQFGIEVWGIEVWDRGRLVYRKTGETRLRTRASTGGV